jgi:hypothetical protein
VFSFLLPILRVILARRRADYGARTGLRATPQSYPKATGIFIIFCLVGHLEPKVLLEKRFSALHCRAASV